MTVTIIVFELNEIDGMRKMMPQIQKDWYDELIVVDGNSTDGTIGYCKQNGYNYFIQKEKGPGAALREAFERAKGDIIVIYAPDGSFLTDRIPIMINEIKNNGADIVNVSRYLGNAISYDDNIATGTANRLFSLLAKLLFRWEITDLLYTYIAFRKDLLKKLNMNTSIITIMQIMMIRAHRNQLRIAEIPGDEPKRVGGDVKVPKIRTAWIILKTLLHEKFRPLDAKK